MTRPSARGAAGEAARRVGPPASRAPRPWVALPRELGEHMEPHLTDVVDEVIAAVGSEVAEYRRPLEGTFGTGVRVGVSVALGRFLELPGTDQPALSAEDREVYVELGRGEVRQGRTMASLLAAYRAGARVALRRFAGLSQAAGVDPELLLPLAEAIFVYIDELSSASVEGYAQAQTARAGEVERTRSEVLSRVLAGGIDRLSIADLAVRAGWRVPSDIVVAVLRGDLATGLALRLGADALLGERADDHVLVAPAPRSQARSRTRSPGGSAAASHAASALGRAIAGTGATVGLPVPLAQAPVSLRTAELAAAVVPRRDAADVVWSEDHLPTLIVQRDRELGAALVARALAPLHGLRPAARERLEETLLAWLTHRGERGRIAADLHVHPQTVGYRLTQLRERFGAALDDPEERFALELALRFTRQNTT